MCSPVHVLIDVAGHVYACMHERMSETEKETQNWKPALRRERLQRACFETRSACTLKPQMRFGIAVTS